MEKLGIITVVEAGDLEQKSRLLIESIRKLGGDLKNVTIWALKPRKGKPISKFTLDFLQKYNVNFLDVDLNRKWHLYGFANKIYASAFIESKYGKNYDNLLFLDSDVMLVQPLEEDFLNGDFAVAIKPHEDFDMISMQSNDDISVYWQMIYKHCRVQANNVWHITTSIDHRKALAYFNTGVIFTKPEYKIFEKWKENFESLIMDINAYHLKYFEFYLLEQCLFSATVVKSFPKNKVRLLTNYYNFSLQFMNKLKIETCKIVFLHYQELFEGRNAECFNFLPKETWLLLKNHLPFINYRKNYFIKYWEVCKYIYWRISNKILLKIYHR